MYKVGGWRVVGVVKRSSCCAQAGEARVSHIIRQRDFSRCTCVVKTPFNMILEARS